MRLLVGIVEGLRDARSVLGLQFSNGEAYNGVLTDLRWPAFIEKEVLFEQSEDEVEAASRAQDYP
jgi:hypothetical protein